MDGVNPDPDESDDPVLAGELEQERHHLGLLYARLDALTAEAAEALDRTERDTTTGTPASRMERDAFATLYADRLAQLRAVEERLCFGRLDLVDGTRAYVGRVGLPDAEGARLMLDWRAPGAQAFYRATPANPDGVLRRRHLVTAARKVTGIEDEVLDLEAFPESGLPDSTVVGDGALLLALNATRTGQMRDIVATIQAEQDRVIRAPLSGVLVVQGGPGTGKTAVALHRTAYLLYAHRDRIASAGVLLVGPGTRFLSYIDQVLPSLGETGVLMATPGQLYPGIDATAEEDPAVAALKGDVRMARVISGAVRARQRLPRGTRLLDVDGTTIELRVRDVAEARGRARASRRPHNLARVTFVNDLLARLARQLAVAVGTELDDDNRQDFLSDLRGSADVRREVNLCWMPLNPEQLVTDLFADPDRLVLAAPHLSPRERRMLARGRGSAWTPADVPLLDEAAELLGEDDTAARRDAARAAAERAVDLEYARGVLQLSGGSSMLTADALLDRYADPKSYRPATERAAEDRTWAFGHLVVDEAQELSPMQWRVLMRRCPSKSMTVVGDIAQTGSAAGARSWAGALDPHVAGRWNLEELTVNYRTPGRIMAVAASLLDAAGVVASMPTSAREGDWAPTAEQVPEGGWARLEPVVRDELARVVGGSVAVLVPRSLRAQVAAGLASVGDSVVVLTANEAKGLEFDVVVVVEPVAIVEESARGVSDLYVAMTRPTQRLTVLHHRPLPPGLSGLTRVWPEESLAGQGLGDLVEVSEQRSAEQ